MTTWTKRRSELALLKRHHPDDTEAIRRAEEALRTAVEDQKVQRAVERVVREVSRLHDLLTADQRETLVDAIRKTGATL